MIDKYESSDHLGNVRATFGRDQNGGLEVFSYADYYPFGWKIPTRQANPNEYRFGYQGEFAEQDQETGWNSFELRMYDGRVGRWMTIDPAEQYWSPYISFGNNPVSFVDPDGAYAIPWLSQETISLINSSINNPSQFITQLFGVRPYEWASYLDRSGGQAIKNIFNDLGTSGLTSSSELYTLAIGEGFYFNHLKENGFNLNNNVNGFYALGTDHFASEASRFVSGGFLPENFNVGDEYFLYMTNNEFGDIVNSATFNGVANALTGFSAVVNHRRSLVLTHGAELGYGTPSDNQLFFWTYYYFQGEGRGQRTLTRNGSWDFSGMRFDTRSQNPTGVGSLSYRRLATWRYIQLRGF